MKYVQELEMKYKALCRELEAMGNVAIAFSGGVDSTFLLKVAHGLLGDKVVAITIRSAFMARREIETAIAFCQQEGITQYVCEVDETEIDGFAENPPNRCYLCKCALLNAMWKVAKKHHIPFLAEGSNLDDVGDYRPGLQAVLEYGVKSPLREAGFRKQEIRMLLKESGVSVWDKPSCACLASRFAYGEMISRDRLHMVERAEEMLQDFGFKQVRVRVHGMLARIEVDEECIQRIMEKQIRKEIIDRMKEMGFLYISVDLQGYRTGTMNEMLWYDKT